MTADIGGDDLLVAVSTVAVGWGAAWFGARISTKNFEKDLQVREADRRIEELATIHERLLLLPREGANVSDLQFNITDIYLAYMRTQNFTIKTDQPPPDSSHELPTDWSKEQTIDRMTALISLVIRAQAEEAHKREALLHSPNLVQRMRSTYNRLRRRLQRKARKRTSRKH